MMIIMYLTMLSLSACQKTAPSSEVKGDYFKTGGTKRMELYWKSLEQWKNVDLKPVQNPVTPVRLLNDPSNTHRIVVVSLPQAISKEETAKKVTEKWKDIYLLFPKKRTSNGAALEIRSPVGPRVFYGTFDAKAYPAIDRAFEYEKWEAINGYKPSYLQLPEGPQFDNPQQKNTAAVLTPEVLAALYISAQAFRNEKYAESVRQIIEVAKPDAMFTFLDDYRVKQYYDGTTSNGKACRVMIELDGTGMVTGMSVAGDFNTTEKFFAALMWVLPKWETTNWTQNRCVNINRFHPGDGYLMTGATRNSFEINTKNGEMILKSRSEWRDLRNETVKDCTKIDLKIETCGDSVKGNFADTISIVNPIMPSHTNRAGEIECKNLRFNADFSHIGEFIDPASKEMLLKKRFFIPKNSAQ